MSKICDRSPCNRLLASLGKHIFGAPDKDGGFYVLVPNLSSADPTLPEVELSIDYCPFCGTRLEEVPAVIIERFMRPRRKRRERPES